MPARASLLVCCLQVVQLAQCSGTDVVRVVKDDGSTHIESSSTAMLKAAFSADAKVRMESERVPIGKDGYKLSMIGDEMYTSESPVIQLVLTIYIHKLQYNRNPNRSVGDAQCWIF